MYDPRLHTNEENKINFFKAKTTEELDKELKRYLIGNKYGGRFSIDILDELFKRKFATTDEIKKLNNLLKNALHNYNTKDRYKHYHCSEKIIFIFRDKIHHNSEPSEDDVMCFVTCLNSFYSAGLDYDKNKSGVWKMTTLIRNNWTKGLKLYEQINDKEINTTNIEMFSKELKLNLSKNSYSFITKFYHQFNDGYPIYDSKLEKLLCLIFPNIKKSVYKEYIKYYNIVFYVLLENLNKQNLKMNVNDFDNAAWILIKEKEEELKVRGEKLTLSTLLN